MGNERQKKRENFTVEETNVIEHGRDGSFMGNFIY